MLLSAQKTVFLKPQHQFIEKLLDFSISLLLEGRESAFYTSLTLLVDPAFICAWYIFYYYIDMFRTLVET